MPAAQTATATDTMMHPIQTSDKTDQIRSYGKVFFPWLCEAFELKDKCYGR